MYRCMSKVMSMLEQLSSIPLFHGLSQKDLEALVTIVMTQECKRGQTIFSEGDEAIGFYVVIGGRVKIFKLSVEGKEQILLVLASLLVKSQFLRGEHFRQMPKQLKKAACSISRGTLL